MENERNLPELYLNIINECAHKSFLSTSEIANKYKINATDPAFSELISMGLIKGRDERCNYLDLTAQGFTTYLMIKSQKESSELSLIAINEATKATKATATATKYARWAFMVSIVTLIVSIIFNVLTLYK